MLIINADDWGLNERASDNSLLCYKNNALTSVSAMMFMSDSERAAELAKEHGLCAGLHLNFTLAFDGNMKSTVLIERQQRIVAFLKRSKYSSIFYNPWLRKDFEYIYKAQYEEFVSLYDKNPSHIDGHHHMHLCTNMLVNKLIPGGSKVRRSFTYSSGEKNLLNRTYRNIVDSILTKRYICTDYFYSISPYQSAKHFQYIVDLAKDWKVEVMVHPEQKREFDYLMSDEYSSIISLVKTGNYGMF